MSDKYINVYESYVNTINEPINFTSKELEIFNEDQKKIVEMQVKFAKDVVEKHIDSLKDLSEKYKREY